MASDVGSRRSTASSTAKCHALVSEHSGKVKSAAKKRQALVNITNQKQGIGFKNQGRDLVPKPSKSIPCSAKLVSIKKGPSVTTRVGATVAPKSSAKQAMVATSKLSNFKSDAQLPKTGAAYVSSIPLNSPAKSDSLSVSMDESISTCSSLYSPEFEYIDNNEIAPVESIVKKASDMLYISEFKEAAGTMIKVDALAITKSDDMIIDVDNNFDDPQLCATIACDIYKHLRASESKKRPAIDFMERVQKDINPTMRAILVDWLVEVAEEYRLVPETLYLAINYIDRYLSKNAMDRQRLQLLGVASLMIASKYEEICSPHVDEFCYITDKTYVREEVLEMEEVVLNCLKFEMTAVTPKCFLRRFVRAAQGDNKVPLLQLECLCNYIAELSLLEYNMLCFAPSLIAASSVFLAKFILVPSKSPWNQTLQHYTLYQPCDLRDCVMSLHGLCYNSHKSTTPAVCNKYSQHKYKFVAKKHCPHSIPERYFHSISN